MKSCELRVHRGRSVTLNPAILASKTRIRGSVVAPQQLLPLMGPFRCPNRLSKVCLKRKQDPELFGNQACWGPTPEIRPGVAPHLLEGEGTADHVAGEALSACSIVGCGADAVVHRGRSGSQSAVSGTGGRTRIVPDGRNAPSATSAWMRGLKVTRSPKICT